MPTLILYLATAIPFLILDALMLTFIMRPLFERHIGAMLLPDIRIVPAVLFYLAYVAGVVVLVSLPALKRGEAVVLPAMILGALAYGTYEFTSFAIMKNWDWTMVAVDLTWGTVLTGVSAWIGVMVARAMA